MGFIETCDLVLRTLVKVDLYLHFAKHPWRSFVYHERSRIFLDVFIRNRKAPFVLKLART